MPAQVNAAPDSWARQYAELLTEYAERPSPELLRRAADLGRTRRQRGTALGEIAAAHTSALAALLGQRGGSTPELVQVVSPVLSQCLEGYGAACEEELQTQRAAQRRFREMADCAQAFLYRIRLDDGSFEYVSPSCDQLTGFTADELRAMGPASVFRRVHPEDQPHVLTPRRDVEAAPAEDRWQRPFAFRFRNRQGEYRWFSGARVLIRNDDGEPVAALGTFQDVTVQRQAEEQLRASEAELRRHREQLDELIAQRTADLARLNERLQTELAEHRRMEQALRESEERFRQLAENIREIFWLSEPKNRKSLYVSPAFEAIWGRPREDVYRDPQAWLSSIHPEDRATTWASFEEQNRGLATDCEYRILRPDGTIRRIRNRGFPIRNAAGEVYRVAGIAEDVTAQRRIEEELRQFKALSDQAAYGAAMIDMTEHVTYVNDAFAQMHGYTPDELLGRHVSVFHDAEQMPRVADLLARLRRDGRVLGEEVWHAHRSGRVFPTLMNITQIADEHGRPAFMSGTAIDITEQRRAEEVLRQSESQLRLITDNVPAMIVYVDAQRRYRFVNERFTKWRSVSREQVLGRPVRAVLGDELYAAIEPHLSAALAGEQVSYERRGDRPGEPEWRSVTYVPDRDARGAVQGVYALIHDITQQKRTEQTLRESEERWQRVLTEMPVLLDAFDAQGNIVVWNRECERVTGYAASEVIGNPDAMRMFYPDAAYRALVLASIRQEHGDHHNVEFELTCKDGSRRTIAWSSISGAVPIPGWATWGVGIDVTERERAEAALRASEKMFRTLAETVPAAIMIGRGDSMRYANETAARIAGCTLDEFLARSPWAFVHPDHQELVRQRSLARQAGQPAPSRYEIRVAGKDGGERWLDMSVATVEYEGWPASLVAALDITERKQAEEAARQHQEQLAHVARVSAVGEMASGLAHELAQPLTAILYFAKGCITRLTSGAWGPAEAVRTLEKVAAQAERAGVFIRQLKTFVRKAERQRVRSDLNGIVREARTHHVDVRLDLAQELPAVVVDPVQIEQVLLNLARNGIEALAPLPAEQRVLTIRTVRGPDDTVQVSVSDSGPGVPPESVPLVFDPFFTTKPGGTGLGLSISRALVEAHNGKLGVEGGPAGGAVFSFVLPVAEGAVDAGR